MTEPTKRTTNVHSISLPAEQSEWLETTAKEKGLPKSKVVQLALLDFKERGALIKTEGTA